MPSEPTVEVIAATTCPNCDALHAHVADLEKQLSETGGIAACMRLNSRLTERVAELEKALRALRRVIPDYRAEVNAVEMADAALAVKEDADE